MEGALPLLGSNSAEADAFESIEVSGKAPSEAAVEEAKTEEEEKKKKKKKKKNKNKNKSNKNKNSNPKPSLLLEAHFPWKMAKSADKGRCAVATRAIKPGEVVVAEHAIAFVPERRFRRDLCHSCGIDLAENPPRKECSSCSYRVLCQKCSELSDASHKQYCRVYEEIGKGTITEDTNCDNLIRLVFELALKKSRSVKDLEDGLSSEATFHDGVIFPSFQDVVELETHQDKVSPQLKLALRLYCIILHKLATGKGKENANDNTPFSCTIEDLELFAAMVYTNSHSMGEQGYGNVDMGLGIFPFASLFNHSCRPNCCFASEGAVMYVRAIQDIPEDAELCVTYTDMYKPRSVRKSQLAATKHFDCRCARCLEPLNLSIDRFLEGCLCDVKGCGGVMVKTSSLPDTQPQQSAWWVCDRCTRVLDPALAPRHLGDKPWEVVSKAERALAAAMGAFREDRFKAAQQMFEDYLAKFNGKLHPLHVLLFDPLTPLMNCYRMLGDAKEAVRVCKLIVQRMEEVVGPLIELANFYWCLGDMHLERARSSSPVLAKLCTEQAEQAFQRAKSIRKICVGKSNLPSNW